MIRVAFAFALLPLAGCFDFTALTECNGSTALVCDGFEHRIVTSTWTASSSGAASGAIDSTHAHASTHAFHVADVPTNGDRYFLQWHDLPQDPTLHVFMRAFAFVPVASPNRVAVMTMVEAGGPTQVKLQLAETGELQLANGFTNTTASAPGAFPIGRWVCIEWEVDEGTARGAMTLWLDDSQAATLPGATLQTTPLGLASIGESYQVAPSSPQPFDAWFDDVVIDVQRITCRQ